MNQEKNLDKYFKICAICGNNHFTNEGEICLSCVELKELAIIRQTLKNKPSLNILTLSKETGIPTSRIFRYIKEEHIMQN